MKAEINLLNEPGPSRRGILKVRRAARDTPQREEPLARPLELSHERHCFIEAA